MKKSFLVPLLLLLTQCVFGYTGNRRPQFELGKNEISVSYGLLPILNITDGIDNNIMDNCESTCTVA